MDFQNKNDKKTDRILAIFSIMFCTIGILSNLISILICLRKELRKVPTFMFLAVLSFIYTLKLFLIALFSFLIEFVVQSIQELNEITINITLFFIFCEYQSSAYLKVSSFWSKLSYLIHALIHLYLPNK